MPARLRITYRKSAIGYPQRQKDAIRALGFHKLYSTIEKDDTPSIRGMVRQVAHLVRVEEIPAGPASTEAAPAEPVLAQPALAQPGAAGEQA